MTLTVRSLGTYALFPALLGMAAVGCGDKSSSSTPTAQQAQRVEEAARTAVTGNGGPSGAHYTLNIIGVPKEKSADMTGNNGHRIFVALEGKSRILLQEGDTFQVLDANGTKGSASFQLPSPDADNDGVTTYSVFARALGKPGGKSITTTTAIDPVTGEEFASTTSLVSVREKGGSKFVNVSKELLYIYADIDADGVIDRVPLFDERLQDYFWSYDNSGLKLLQLRFYPQPTDVN
jgi:hypothetical protein